MKKEDLFCPYCGAPISPVRDGSNVCVYCGSKIPTHNSEVNYRDARKFGHDFELGRFDAQDSKPGRQLAEEIKKLLQPLDDLNQTKTIIKEISDKMQASNEKIEKNTKAYSVFLLPFVVLAVIVWLYGSESIGVAFLIGLFIFGYLWIKRKVTSTVLTNDANTLLSRYKEASEHLEYLTKNYNFELIPEEYRNHEAMSFFVQVLSNGRSSTLQQAINTYEDEKHKKTMLRLKKEEVRLQEQQIELQQKNLEQQAELAASKKSVDWGAVAAAAGSIAIAVLTLKGKRK